jgi:hypothetical protein
MDFRNEALAELARDAALERSDFLVRAGEQLERFMKANGGRIRSLGGLVLLDSDEEYLAVAPDGTYRSRSRVYDEDTGDWVSETEIIEAAAELVELYNPADIYAAFAEAAENAEAAMNGEGQADGADGADGLTIRVNGEDPYAGAADRWAAVQPEGVVDPNEDDGTDEAAARLLYDLALDFQERSQVTEARLITQFEEAAAGFSSRVGEIVVTEDDDERLVLATGARFRASVLSEESGKWEALEEATQLVEYYDPTDVFSDLADAIAEAWPSVAPAGEAVAGEGEGAEASGGAEGGAPA